MNFEELMATAITRTIEQGVPSAQEGQCFYRGSDGNKCAVGHIISDEFYSELLEDHSCENDDVIRAIENSNGISLKWVEVEQLEALQNCHDDASTYPDDFVSHFRNSIRRRVESGMLSELCLKYLGE